MMKYKGYQGCVVYDDEAKLFHGEVIGLKDMITFQGLSVDELEQAFKDSVEDYLAFCKELGRHPEKPYSGKVLVRMSSKDHERAAFKAKATGLSMNEWINQTLHEKLYSEEQFPEKKRAVHKKSPRGRGRQSKKLQEA